MDDCLFCKIISGQIPAYKVWEDEKHLAFLDIFPLKKGHTLVIPKAHHPYLFDIPDNEIQDLTLASKKVAEILKKVFNPKTGKVGVIVYGLDVDHTHVHLIPLNKSGDLNFANKKKAKSSELEKTLAQIKSSI